MGVLRGWSRAKKSPLTTMTFCQTAFRRVGKKFLTGLACLSPVPRTAISRRRVALAHAVIPHYGGHPQAVIIEYGGAALGLRCPVRFQPPPCRDRVFVTPEG